MKNFSEFDWLSTLKKEKGADCALGIGDDAALFGKKDLWAISTDSLVEGIHFLSGDTPFAIGQKCASANLSDMAAMGCKPRFFLLNLHVGGCLKSLEAIELFMNGLRSKLDKYEVLLIGGDTVSSPSLATVVGTILGEPYSGGPVCRKGAKAEDVIVVTGKGLGGSFPKRHLSFEPRVEWSRILCEHQVPTALMDISDGLLQDLGHLLDQSALGAKLELWTIPLHPDIAHLPDALNRALSDGEDFELLFTAAQASLKKIEGLFPFTVIGKVVEDPSWTGKIRGQNEPRGEDIILPRKGYCHK